MTVNLVRIGNSKGIRIPKPIIEQCGFGETVRLSVQKGRLIVEPDSPPRSGWAEEFRRNSAGRGQLILDGANAFDSQEWEW